MQITKKPDLIFKKPERRATADLSKSAGRVKSFQLLNILEYLSIQSLF